MEEASVWASLPTECTDEFPVEWALQVLSAVCVDVQEVEAGAATKLAAALVTRLGASEDEARVLAERPGLSADVHGCLVRMAVAEQTVPPAAIARLLLARYGHLRSGEHDKDLCTLARELAGAVGLDEAWWRAFWGALPKSDPFPLRGALSQAMAAEFGWRGALHFLHLVMPLEDLTIRGSGPQISIMGRSLSRMLPSEAHRPEVLVPTDCRLPVAMLFAIPEKLKWPFAKSPILSRPSFKRAIDDYLATRPGPDLSDEQLWRVSLLGNHLVFQGPAGVADYVTKNFGQGIGASYDAHDYMASAVLWLGVIDEYAEIPGATDHAPECREAVRSALAATKDSDLDSFVIRMSDLGHFLPHAGTTRERLIGLVGSDRARTLSTQAQTCLGL